MKRHIFLTGQPGVGKTTLVRSILARLGETHDLERVASGFYTQEVREGGVRSGFDVITLRGRVGPLARLEGSPQAPRVGKYVVDVPSFESLAIPTLTDGRTRSLVVVDEVGRMELFSALFYPTVLQVMSSGPVVLGTIPTPSYGRKIPEVEEIRHHPEVKVVVVTRANRDSLVDEIVQHLVGQMH